MIDRLESQEINNIRIGLEEIIKGLMTIQEVIKKAEVKRKPVSTMTDNSINNPEIIDIDTIRRMMVQKTKQGKGAEVKELLNIFHVEKLSDITEENFTELYHLAEKL